jgi:competence protein ComEC
MRLFNIVIKRPFITLTVLYILALILLDLTGFFAHVSHDTVSPFISESYTEVKGRILNVPEQKNGKLRFVVRVSSVNGQKADGKILVTLFARDGEAPVAQGDVIAFGTRLLSPPPARNPGTFDYAAYLNRKGIYTVAYIASCTKIGHSPLPFYQAAANAIRIDMTATLQRYLPQREAGILTPMVIGDKNRLSDEEKQAFRDSGLTHILVVSGLNVAYVVAVFLGLFRLTGLRRRYAALCTIPFILLFMLIAGDNPPVIRATVMAIFVILSLALSREPLIYQSLALAAAVNLIADPQALFTASFQLSFAATAGIVYLYPFLMKPFENLPRWLRVTVGSTFAVSLAAQLAVLPIIAYDFNRIPVIGVVSNIVVVPWAGLITALGIVVYLAHFVSPFITAAVAGLTAFLLHWMLYFVHLFARLPFATVSVATPPPAAIIVYYLLLAGMVHSTAAYHLVLRRKEGWKPARIFCVIVLPALCLLPLLLRATGKTPAPEAPVTITSLYAGNGTAVHIAFQNRHWLIDTGRTRDGERVLLPYLRSKGIRHIEGIIITSGDKHHCGGLGTMISGFDVKQIFYPRGPGETIACLRGNGRDRNILFEEVCSSASYHIDGSTLTLFSIAAEKRAALAIAFDHAGKRMVFIDHGDLPADAAQRALLRGRAVDILHLSCHRKETAVAGCIDLLKPGAILLSGTPPEQTPDGRKYYSLRQQGSVTVKIDTGGTAITAFRNASPE